MADWLGNRSNVRHRYGRVSWGTWEEVGQYANITGGSTEWSYFTDLKVQGSLKYDGAAPSQLDLVRDYYGFTDDSGESAEVCVSTMLCERTKATVHELGREDGSVQCYSVLKVLGDRLFGFPYTVPAGTRAVALARELAESVGLRVNARTSTYTTSQDHTFDSDDSYLKAVNWLLATAGCSSAYPDAYGTVQMQPYVEPTARRPVFEFVDGRESIMRPQPDWECDRSGTPNVVRAVYEDEWETLWAYAANVDEGNMASLPSRGGREYTAVETVDDLSPSYRQDGGKPVIDEATRKLRLASMEAEAKRKLLDNSADIEYVEIRHGFNGVTQGDPVSVRYADRTWAGTVTNVTFDHAVSSECKTKVRRYVTSELKLEVGSGVL